MTKTIGEKTQDKAESLQRLRDKLTNLDAQIEIYQNARERVLEEIPLREEELREMEALVASAEKLEAQRAELLPRLKVLSEEYNARPWTPDSAGVEWEKQGEYDEVTGELSAISASLEGLTGRGNQVYYGRFRKEKVS